MFSLVRFKDDDIISVVLTNRLKMNISREVIAPYGKMHYLADVLLKSDNKNSLLIFKNNINQNLPIIRLEKYLPEVYERKKSDTIINEKIKCQDITEEESIDESTNDNTDITFNPSSSYFEDIYDNNDDECEQPMDIKKFTPPSQLNKNRTFATTEKVPTVEEGSMRNYCLFCHKLVVKIVRHLSMVHSTEEAVKSFLCLPKKSKERKAIITKIKNEANFKFNTDNNLFQTGKLVVRRRPKNSDHKSEIEYLPCGNCKGFYSKKNLRNHFRTCTERHFLNSKQTLALGRRVRASIHPKACDLLRDKIFPILREDENILQIRYDELLITYANNLCMKFASRPQCYALIRNKIRKMGVFLAEMKSIDKKIENLSMIFHPKHYDRVVQCIFKMGKYDYLTGEMKAPSTAFDVGTQLKIMCEILHCEYIKMSDEKKIKEVEQMSVLLKRGLSTSVNVNVKDTQINNARRKTVVLPSTEDVSKLMNYLYTNQETNLRKLSNQFKLQYWVDLTKFTLLCIETFNRRRPGETERILIEDYNRKVKISAHSHPEIFKTLNPEDLKLVNKYSVFELRGKRVKNVSVLINNEIQQGIELILRYRRQAGVPDSNPYVFGEPYSSRAEFDNRFYRVCPLLRKASLECGANKPETLRSVQLRKHVASQAILLHSKYGFQTKQLAKFMGHHHQIHEDYYQISELSVQLTGIGRLLEHIQGPVEVENHVTSHESLQTSFQDDAIKSPLFKSTPFPKHKRKATSPNSNFVLDFEVSSSEESSYEKSIKKRKRSSEDLGKEFIPRRSWSKTERTIARKHFEKYFTLNKLPSARELRHALQILPPLQSRTEAQLRTWLHSEMKRCRLSPEIKIKSSERAEIIKYFQNHIETQTTPSNEEFKRVRSEIGFESTVKQIKAVVSREITKKRHEDLF